jgi:hypothetical protein
MSTGTNNVFPRMLEGTVVGLAAAAVARGMVPIDEAADRAKVVHVTFEDGSHDVALIDAALVASAFVGSRALWDPATIRVIVLTRAEPAAVGLSAIGGALDPLGSAEDAALFVEAGGGGPAVRAAIAPGLFSKVPIGNVRRLALGEEVVLHGAGMLAFDGERERPLRDGELARLTVRRDGPYVIDVPRVLAAASRLGAFRAAPGGCHGN